MGFSCVSLGEGRAREASVCTALISMLRLVQCMRECALFLERKPDFLFFSNVRAHASHWKNFVEFFQVNKILF